MISGNCMRQESLRPSSMLDRLEPGRRNGWSKSAEKIRPDDLWNSGKFLQLAAMPPAFPNRPPFLRGAAQHAPRERLERCALAAAKGPF
jgi:hypothetical protein